MADYSVDYTFTSGLDKNGQTRYFYINNQTGKKVELPDAQTYENFKSKANTVTNKDYADSEQAQQEANPVIQEMDDMSAALKERMRQKKLGNKHGGAIKIPKTKVSTGQTRSKKSSNW